VVQPYVIPIAALPKWGSLPVSERPAPVGRGRKKLVPTTVYRNIVTVFESLDTRYGEIVFDRSMLTATGVYTTVKRSLPPHMRALTRGGRVFLERVTPSAPRLTLEERLEQARERVEAIEATMDALAEEGRTCGAEDTRRIAAAIAETQKRLSAAWDERDTLLAALESREGR